MPWPAPIPARTQPDARDELFVTVLGDVKTPLADATYDPAADRLTPREGAPVENYFKEKLGLPHYRPIDKSVFPYPPSGWCSWYFYYQEVSAPEIMVNARWLAENLRIYGARYIQIDDGWQGTGHGEGSNRDWTTIDPRFEDMAELAGEIRKLGMLPGLWLAPHGQSNEAVVKESGAFLLKPDGSSASSTWEGTYLVDPTRPQAKDYLTGLFKRLQGQGYEYFKIDGQPIVLDEYRSKQQFMAGQRPEGVSPEQWADTLYRGTLETIREAIGPRSYLLGCWGIPLPGVGLMHGSRTSGDVVPGWSGFL